MGAEKLKQDIKLILEGEYADSECFDDVSGVRLDVEMMKAARMIEMDYFSHMGVLGEVAK